MHRAPYRGWIRALAATLGLLVCLSLAGCETVQAVGFHFANRGVDASAIASVAYDPGRGLSLDVHRPPDHRTGVPVIVFFHGGSWRNGSRIDYRFAGQSLAQAGYVVIVPDYRKAPQFAFPAFMEDAADAEAWAKRHAAEYGGDPSRIYVMGHSAGAHIAALLGTDARFLQATGMRPRDLAGVIGLSGPYDFLPITSPAIREAFGPASGWAATQPVNFVDGDEPPFLLLQGKADVVVLPRNATALAERLQAEGEPVELHLYDGMGHPGTLVGLMRVDQPVRQVVIDWIAHTPRISAAAAPLR